MTRVAQLLQNADSQIELSTISWGRHTKLEISMSIANCQISLVEGHWYGCPYRTDRTEPGCRCPHGASPGLKGATLSPTNPPRTGLEFSRMQTVRDPNLITRSTYLDQDTSSLISCTMLLMCNYLCARMYVQINAHRESLWESLETPLLRLPPSEEHHHTMLRLR